MLDLRFVFCLLDLEVQRARAQESYFISSNLPTNPRGRTSLPKFMIVPVELMYFVM